MTMKEILRIKAERDALDAKLRELCEGIPWPELMDAGLTVEAVRAYRDMHDCDVRTAYSAVMAHKVTRPTP
jgi:hypothetical protein